MKAKSLILLQDAGKPTIQIIGLINPIHLATKCLVTIPVRCYFLPPASTRWSRGHKARARSQRWLQMRWHLELPRRFRRCLVVLEHKLILMRAAAVFGLCEDIHTKR